MLKLLQHRYSTTLASVYLQAFSVKMTWYWRAAGLNYVKYSNVCARALRKCLKPEIRAEAMKRDDDTIIKVAKWEGGKPVGKTAPAS